jgi:hypothetical protein
MVLAALAFLPAAANAGSGHHPYPRARCGSFPAAVLNEEGIVVSHTPVRVETYGPHLTCQKASAVVRSFWNPEEELIVHEPEPPYIETTYGLKDWPGWTCRVSMPLKSHGNEGECERGERTAAFYFGGT